MFKSIEFKVGKLWFCIGMSKRFAIGFYVDRYFAGIDLLCFWISVEL
jgi:hypothetical protein